MSISPYSRRRYSCRKGQVFASDFVISVVLFIVMLIAAADLWNIASLKYSKSSTYEIMQKKAFSITDTLIKTEGYPKNWTNATVRLIGVSEEKENVLSKRKLLEMRNISYSDLRTAWGVSDYEVYLKFTNSSGDLVALDDAFLEYGLFPSQEKDLVPLRRLVLINDSGTLVRSTLMFMVWRD